VLISNSWGRALEATRNSDLTRATAWAGPFPLLRGEGADRVCLTVPPPAADLVLAPLIVRFLSQYPEISFDISVDRAFIDIVEARAQAPSSFMG
jgi:DNA-binding transcriptional LysR family regulator